MARCVLFAFVIGTACSGCSYALKHTVSPPAGMKFKTTVEGQSWGYSGFLALKEAEVRASKTLPEKAVAKTIQEKVNCNYQGLLYVPGVNIIAAFIPLCHAEIKQAVFTGSGGAVVTDSHDVGVTVKASKGSSYWLRASQCKANRCSPCPNWPTEAQCVQSELGGHACIELQGERPACQ